MCAIAFVCVSLYTCCSAACDSCLPPRRWSVHLSLSTACGDTRLTPEWTASLLKVSLKGPGCWRRDQQAAARHRYFTSDRPRNKKTNKITHRASGGGGIIHLTVCVCVSSELKSHREPMLTCELCGREDFAYVFKRSKRFCSTGCAKR